MGRLQTTAIQVHTHVQSHLIIRLLSKLPIFSFLLVTFLFCLIFISNIALANKQDNKNNKKIIAIPQIVEHSSLEQAKKGILDVLRENGYKNGDNIEIIDKNAQGSIATALIIAKQFVAIKPDVIVPISTPSAQSVVSSAKNTDIPIVFCSVTDPVSAGLVKTLQVPTLHITGAMDFPLIVEEIELIKTLRPGVKTIGLLYSAGEANSVKTIALMKEAIQKNKLVYTESVVTNSNQVGQAFMTLIGRVDVIYIPSDNTVFSAMPKLVSLSKIYKLPVFSSDPDSVRQGVFACIGYTQYAVGRTAGELLVKVLKGEKNLIIQKPAQAEIFINQKYANILNIVIPDKIMGLKPEIVK